MRRPFSDLRRSDYVWLAHTWPWPVVLHDRDERDNDRELTLTVRIDEHRVERTGIVAGWAFTRCGLITYHLSWQPGWSDEQQRFSLSTPKGHDLPLRLLNPAETRPCRSCFEDTR